MVGAWAVDGSLCNDVAECCHICMYVRVCAMMVPRGLLGHEIPQEIKDTRTVQIMDVRLLAGLVLRCHSWSSFLYLVP